MIIFKEETKKEKFERKVKEAAATAKNKTVEIYHWAKENPREAIFIVTTVTGVVGAVIRGASAAADRRDMQTRVWDPVDGIYHYTRKPMTTSQKLEFSRRVANGEARGDILDDMGVLRR